MASLVPLRLFGNRQTPSVDPSTFAAALAIVWVLVVLIPVGGMVTALAIETVRAAVGNNNLEIRSSGKAPRDPEPVAGRHIDLHDNRGEPYAYAENGCP
jgi:hypothetical protein